MTKSADKVVSLAELRFKPANSNDAARAVLSHHFVNVPRCSFAKDDGISQYLGSETGMGIFPASLDETAPDNTDVPIIEGEAPDTSGSLRRKLLRGGFALSIFLHVIAAGAVGYATLSLPDETVMEEGVTAVTIVMDGDSATDAKLAGAEEEVKDPDEPIVEPVVKPVEKPIEKPVEKVAEKPVEPIKQPVVKQPLPTLPETIVKDDPLPEPGVAMPEILTAKTETQQTTEPVAKSVPTEEKVEPQPEKPVMDVPVEKPVEVKQPEAAAAVQPLAHPVSKPVEVPKVVEKVVEKPVEKQPEEKPKPVEKKVEEPKQPLEKKLDEKKTDDKPVKKRRQNKGNHGKQTADLQRGGEKSGDKREASISSRGDSTNREAGDAARTNYKGLINKKLSRAKERIQAPARGKVTVAFTIRTDGSVSGLRVTSGSGKPALDATALKIVQNASPFPPIPAEAGKKSWLMTVPMTFKR